MKGCELCENAGGEILWEDDFCRAVWAYQPDHPGLCRVICDRHVKEMTDLEPTERERIMKIVFATEQAVVKVLRPNKVNLASLGNLVPHIHWHVVPRFTDDPHFPHSIWSARLREGGHPLPPDFGIRMRRILDALLKAPELKG